jgi:hypothetical protein
MEEPVPKEQEFEQRPLALLAEAGNKGDKGGGESNVFTGGTGWKQLVGPGRQPGQPPSSWREVIGAWTCPRWPVPAPGRAGGRDEPPARSAPGPRFEG